MPPAQIQVPLVTQSRIENFSVYVAIHPEGTLENAEGKCFQNGTFQGPVWCQGLVKAPAFPRDVYFQCPVDGPGREPVSIIKFVMEVCLEKVAVDSQGQVGIGKLNLVAVNRSCCQYVCR